ncbi:3'-5' exonuclease [Streptomyces sp. PsTaAH-124]|uniref:3'-5' exonuclease n=1 Tax=Streptomyces sp. PsTaAH-124 TaxID=1157638 RepID=UPI00036DA2D0|nr:3'-5' exonuclease [Streptomyces sp. PsTaAH-124]
MSTTTATATERIPSSRTEADPARVAKGKPLSHKAGVPVYSWGQAPPYLRTRTQLAADRLNVTAEQDKAPLAYVSTRDYGDVPLHDPAAAVKMRPLPSSTKARMTARRTCPECGKVRKVILRGPCSVCRERARKAQDRLFTRTCRGCNTVRERPYPKGHRRCPSCRKQQLEEKRARVEAWLIEVTVCAGDGCTKRLGSKKAARAWLREQPWALRPDRPSLPDAGCRPGWARRCPPCQKTYDVEQARRQAENQARYEREARECREAEARAAEERCRWAAAALVDPDVLVLDAETTGLGEDARIVELAVLNARGEILLDTLLDPGVPVPGDAAAIHGITTEALVGAPTFSDVLVKLTGLLDGKRCLIYNQWYDVGRLRHELTLHYLDRAAREAAEETVRTGTVPEDVRERAAAEAAKQATAWLDAMHFEDVMIPFSDWVGDWSEYHGNNRWQPLNGGHRAAGDCRAVLDCLRQMGRRAAAYTEELEMETHV